ncbi:MFS transporter [Paenibacillus popilliae]|uniref:Permease n=1 Tax=Paenibacillus popilliae ATCC 14706 TaxID=1212764 RepID=M9L830_PAEPP|nr:MFS transporter [Paenibacillus popilliae]GAC41237.1 permease [Paenibacillus popilliae ATCC 14706]
MYERKGLRMLLLLFLIINVGCAIQPVLPLFVTRVLKKGSEAFAQLELVFGLGLIIGSIGMTVIGRIRNQVLAIVGGLVVGGVLELTIGLQQELWMTLLIAFLFGIVLPVINASSTAIWLESVPNALQGRVFSIRASVAQTGIPIGYLLNGYLSDLYGPSFVFVVGGLLLILISLLALGSDSFRNLNRRSATIEKEYHQQKADLQR